MKADGSIASSASLDTMLAQTVDGCQVTCEITEAAAIEQLVTATVDDAGLVSIAATDSFLHEQSHLFAVTCESILSAQPLSGSATDPVRKVFQAFFVEFEHECSPATILGPGGQLAPSYAPFDALIGTTTSAAITYPQTSVPACGGFDVTVANPKDPSDTYPNIQVENDALTVDANSENQIGPIDDVALKACYTNHPNTCVTGPPATINVVAP